MPEKIPGAGDERLRELERKWKESGAVEDEAAYLNERVRRGELLIENVEIAAILGDPVAIKVFPEHNINKISDNNQRLSEFYKRFENLFSRLGVEERRYLHITLNFILVEGLVNLLKSFIFRIGMLGSLQLNDIQSFSDKIYLLLTGDPEHITTEESESIAELLGQALFRLDEELQDCSLNEYSDRERIERMVYEEDTGYRAFQELQSIIDDLLEQLSEEVHYGSNNNFKNVFSRQEAILMCTTEAKSDPIKYFSRDIIPWLINRENPVLHRVLNRVQS